MTIGNLWNRYKTKKQKKTKNKKKEKQKPFLMYSIFLIYYHIIIINIILKEINITCYIFVY